MPILVIVVIPNEVRDLRFVIFTSMAQYSNGRNPAHELELIDARWRLESNWKMSSDRKRSSERPHHVNERFSSTS